MGTCDKDLKRRLRKVPGVPIMSIKQRKFSVERMPDALGGMHLPFIPLLLFLSFFVSFFKIFSSLSSRLLHCGCSLIVIHRYQGVEVYCSVVQREIRIKFKQKRFTSNLPSSSPPLMKIKIN